MYFRKTIYNQFHKSARYPIHYVYFKNSGFLLALLTVLMVFRKKTCLIRFHLKFIAVSCMFVVHQVWVFFRCSVNPRNQRFIGNGKLLGNLIFLLNVSQ